MSSGCGGIRSSYNNPKAPLIPNPPLIHPHDLPPTHLLLIPSLAIVSCRRRDLELGAEKQRARAEFLRKLEQDQQRNAREQAKVVYVGASTRGGGGRGHF